MELNHQIKLTNLSQSQTFSECLFQLLQEPDQQPDHQNQQENQVASVYLVLVSQTNQVVRSVGEQIHNKIAI